MATRSSTLAWRIPWRERPGRLQSMGHEYNNYSPCAEIVAADVATQDAQASLALGCPAGPEHLYEFAFIAA